MLCIGNTKLKIVVHPLSRRTSDDFRNWRGCMLSFRILWGRWLFRDSFCVLDSFLSLSYFVSLFVWCCAKSVWVS